MMISYDVEELEKRITIDLSGSVSEDDHLAGCKVILIYEDRLIMAYHPYRKGWEFPGGKLEPRESLQQCAVREVWEETGALLSELQLLGTYRVEGNDYLIHSAIYLGKVKSLEKLPIQSEMEKIGIFKRLPENLSFPDHVYRIVLEHIGFFQEIGNG